MARKHSEEEHENHERWLVSYADFITLLFAFFTVLYATSPKDVKKQQEIEASVKAAFQQMIDMGGVIGGGPFRSFEKLGSPIEPPFLLFPRKNMPPTEMADSLLRAINAELEKENVNRTMISLRHDSKGVRLSLSANELFAPGSAQLNPDAVATVDQFANILMRTNRHLVIEGHTDDQAIKGSGNLSNWELSANRATTIVRYLIARHKFSPGRLTAVAMADQRPLAPNNSEVNRAKNRRIEIVILTDKEEENFEKTL